MDKKYTCPCVYGVLCTAMLCLWSVMYCYAADEKQNLNGGDHIVGEARAAGAVFDKHLVQQTSVL